MTSTMLYEALTVKPPTSWSSGLEPNTQLYSNMSVYGEPVNIKTVPTERILSRIVKVVPVWINVINIVCSGRVCMPGCS
jgi:hypothetical protein